MEAEKLTIGERLNIIIKSNNLTQAKFAESIVCETSEINKFVNNKRNMTPKVIELICEKYNINSEWLKYGKGQMNKDLDIGKYKEVLNKFKYLNEDFQNLVLVIINSLIKIQNKLKKS